MKLLAPLLLCFCSLAHNTALAQSGTVTGFIKEVSGKPIPNANIVIEGSSSGASSDETGAYTISGIVKGTILVKVTAVGYKSQTMVIHTDSNEDTKADFSLEEDNPLLREVEIYGIKSITGMGYLDEVHGSSIYAGKKTEVILLDSLNANTAQNNPREVLGRIPGANYSETEGAGFPSNGIAFRGLAPSQSVETNTRQNGYNITADLYGYPESYYLPPLEGVERIEVIRGASSLQYGPQFGGVINYMMKRGNRSKPFEFITQETAGSFGMFNTFNSIGGQLGKLNYYAYGQFQRTDGWRPNSTMKKFTGFASLEYAITDRLKIGVEYSALRNKIQMPGGLSDSMFNVNPRSSARSRNWLTSPWNVTTIKMDWKLSSRTRMIFQSSFNNSGRALVWRNEEGGPQAEDGIDPTTGTYTPREVENETFGSNTTEIKLLTNYQMKEMKNTLVTGIRFFKGNMHRQGGGEGTTGTDFDLSLTSPGYEYDLTFATTNAALFFENTFRLSEKISITPGARYEYILSGIKGYHPNEIDGGISYPDFSRVRNIFLAGAGLQYNLTTTTNFYANWTQAYRPLDYSSITPFGTIATVDPNLRDSHGYNADLGYRGTIGNFLNFDIGGFYLQYNDRVGIIEKTDVSGNLYPFRTNVANSEHKGVESYIEFNPARAFHGNRSFEVSFFNSFAWIDARYTSGEFTGKHVEYAPQIINRFGLTFTLKKFSTTLLSSYTARSYGDAANSEVPSPDAVAGVIPAYHVLDWSASLQVKRYQVRFGCNNLSDEHYFTKRTDEYPGPGIIPSVGRSFYLGIGARF